MAPKKRDKKNAWLEQYPGLYIRKDGGFYVKHPTTGKQASLGTKNRAAAIRLWKVLAARWEQERGTNVDAIEQRLNNLSVPKSQGDHIHLSDYLHQWRTQMLGHQVVNGNVVWGECKVLAQRGKRRGHPVAKPTRTDYANDCRQLEQQEAARFPLSDPKIVTKLRKLLKPWLQKPVHYNGLRNTLSRVLAHAVDEGLIERNPILDIRKAHEQKREVLIPDEAYRAITEQLRVHRLNKREFDGTWRAKVCDLIYMMSQQPIDVFGAKEKQATLYDTPKLITLKDEQGAVVDQYEVWGLLTFARHKTTVGIELEMNKELRDLWQWFIDFKRKQGIISEYLMVYPMYMDVRSRAKPVRHRFMQSAWREACEAAGYGYQYQLRDLRKTGLTNEYVAQGENDKGGHETEAMRKHYRLITPPKRARSTLTSMGEG